MLEVGSPVTGLELPASASGLPPLGSELFEPGSELPFLHDFLWGLFF